MISSLFKKVGKGKVLAVVRSTQTSVNMDMFNSKSAQSLTTLVNLIKSNAFDVAPSAINTALHGSLATKPISLNSSELKVIIGARSHNDSALECTITDLITLAEKDIHAAGGVAEQITDIFISKSGTIRDAALVEAIAIGTIRKFKAFLTEHHSVFHNLTGMNKVNSVVDLLNELRRIQSRLVEPDVIAHFCHVLNAEILPLDILGPTLRFGITDSLSRFYLNQINESYMVIGINAHGAPSLCENSDATHFAFIQDGIDHNTNKSVIKRISETKSQELDNLFTHGPVDIVIYNATSLKGSIKSLNHHTQDEITKLLERNALEEVDTITNYGFSTIENLENITLRALAKNYQNDLRFTV